MKLDAITGRVDSARWVPSPNCDAREHHTRPEVVIIHSISLPPGEYHNTHIEQFFCNQLDFSRHPYFVQIEGLRVSSHFLIGRDGELVQFVATDQRAWHAGESLCLGKPQVNDFSIGIELQGLDEGDDGYTDAQYICLNELLNAVNRAYPAITRQKIFAHSDIAPGRKTDPGQKFDWSRVI